MENAWSTMPDRIPGLLKQRGQYSRSTEQDDPWSMVAFGDRKDFLQVLRMVHFLRKCTMRRTCKRDISRGRGSACISFAPTVSPALCPGLVKLDISIISR